MVHVAGSAGVIGGGSWPGPQSQDAADTFVAWTFTSDSALTVAHIVPGASDDQNISWEVIEWDVGAAAPVRRVMVSG
jgi:hypothetical protein